MSSDRSSRGSIYRIWSRRDKSTAEHSPVDSGTPPGQEAQAESTGKRQPSTFRSEDTACKFRNILKQFWSFGILTLSRLGKDRYRGPYTRVSASVVQSIVANLK
ncbi:hypothetical protein UY3_13002 [Chelonia mydas]|uniref:Uncharacterized protein n=1 Tax=Chelonia mydas TaxID=8469 RepID=M7BP05_CHEMY|nr:hypothetical protein UY3_13002 [Chelonia mydas]